MLAISLEFLTLHARKCILLFCTLIILILCCEAGEIIYAVNCGGSSHVDSFGIRYQKDPHNIGVASDHGKVLSIRRVPSMDQILYQTERYHTESFAYNIPISVDGDYVLVLKFSEVWFTEPNKKVIISFVKSKILYLLIVFFIVFYQFKDRIKIISYTKIEFNK